MTNMKRYVIHFKHGVTEGEVWNAISGCRALRRSRDDMPHNVLVKVDVPDNNADALEGRLDADDTVQNWVKA